MPDDSFQSINQNYHNLTRKQKEILDVLLTNPENVCYISLKDLSERTQASEVTILRMCKRLGFENFIEMKKAFRVHTERLVKNFLKTNYFPLNLPASEAGDRSVVMREICSDAKARSEEFYSSVRPDDILLAAQRILSAKNVLICGQGASAVVADFFFRRLSPLVPNAIFVHPEDMDNVQSGLLKLQKGDNVIAVTFPRYYTAIRDIVQFAEYRGAAVTAITDGKDSPAVTKNSLNFLCNTMTKVFYNSFSLPIELVNLISSGVVLEMGPAYDELVSRSHEVIHFINEKEAETDRETSME